jgi:hypothetical protein
MQRKALAQVEDHQRESGRFPATKGLSISVSCLRAHLLRALKKRPERGVFRKRGVNFSQQAKAKNIGVASLVGSAKKRSCGLLNRIPPSVMFGQPEEPDDGAEASQCDPQLVNGFGVFTQQKRFDIRQQMNQGFAKRGGCSLTNGL